jgi:hypothetical protein
MGDGGRKQGVLQLVSIMNFPDQFLAADYRRQAAAVRAVANSISLNDVKQDLIETAKRLDALAAEEDRKAQNPAPIQSSQPREALR